MFTAKFFVDGSRNNDLRLRITNNRKNTSMTMGIRISGEALEDSLSKDGSPDNRAYRSLLMRWLSVIEDVKIRLVKEGRINEDVGVIRDILRVEFFGEDEVKPESEPKPKKKKEPSPGTFMPFFEKHTAHYEKRSTRESNEYTMSVLRKYAELNKIDLAALNFEDINYAWLSDLEQYMKAAKMSQNTRKIHFGNIRTAMREAYKRELTDADPFRRFTFRPAKTRKRSLTVEELRRLFTCEVAPHAEYYRDMMKLSFMLLGINMIDLYSLKEIKHGRIEYDRSKTGGLFSIRLEPEAMEIIEKYQGDKALLNIADRWHDHRNFRHQLNAAIKRIGKAQGKGKRDKEEDSPFAEVTSYWMRHTWGTIAYELGISDDTISQALGHQGSGARVTEVYIRRNMDKVDEANRRVLDWVLYGKR